MKFFVCFARITGIYVFSFLFISVKTGRARPFPLLNDSRANPSANPENVKKEKRADAIKTCSEYLRGGDGEKTNSDIQTRSEKPVAFIFLPVAEKRGKSFPFCHKIGVRRGVKGDRLKAETEQRLRSAGKHGEYSCGGKTVKVSNMKSRKRGAE